MSNFWLQRQLNGTGNTGYQHNNHAATPQQLDSFLANSMNKLDVRQRESILEELHGIRTNENPESNPTSVDLWLEMLDTHLQNMKRWTVYEIAEVMDRAYVNSRSFRLMFLRASRYDPEGAAKQVIRFLDLKRSLFGQEKLTKKITLADLSDQDKQVLESGAVQVSRERDRSGREILLIYPSLQRTDETHSMEAMLRSRFYTIMTTIESEENQKNGIVLVYFGALPAQPNQHSSNKGLLWDLPVFIAGIHCCLNELSVYIFVSLAILSMPSSRRPRIRVHYGSCTECLYKLSSFGIPKEAIVTDMDEPRLNDHSEWCRQRQEIESAQSSNDSDTDTLLSSAASPAGEIIPQPCDVLFGAGSRNNQGNLMLRSLVLGMMEEHQESRKGKKMEISENIMDEIKKKGGRFLRQNEETKEWEEASLLEVSRKIAHTFRNIRRQSRTTKKA